MTQNEISLLLQNEDFQTIFKSQKEKIEVVELFEQVKKEIASNILTQFGLSQFYDNFQKGGSVTTLHNARANVFPGENGEDQKRFNNKFDRTNYEGKKLTITNLETGKKEVIYDSTLSGQRKNKFSDNMPLKDAYTGKDLQKDGSTHLDHITSAKHIHSDDALRLYMSDYERSVLATSDKNMAYTNSSLNQSKGEHDLKDWVNKTQKKQTQNNADRFGIDVSKALEKDKESKEYLKKAKNRARRDHYIKNTSKAAGRQALNQGKKQVVGVLVYEISDMFFSVLTPILRKWNSYDSMTSRMDDFKRRCTQEVHSMQDRVKPLLLKLVASGNKGAVSGIVSTIIETVINTFMTTAASFGKILCDGIQGIISAFKIIVSKDSSITKKEKIKKAVEIIGSAIIASTGVLITETISKKLLLTPFAPFAEEIGTVLGMIITGFFTASLIFTIENFGEICSQVKDGYALMKYGATVTKGQIELEYQSIIDKIDDAYTVILTRIHDEYKTLNKLQEMASDFSLIAEEQFRNSISYADAMKVSTDRILKNQENIDDYFLN